MTPHEVAAALLDAVTDVADGLSAPLCRAVVEVSRNAVADDERQVVVTIDRIGLLKPRAASVLPGGMCVAVPFVECAVRFTADCAPQPSQPGIPPPADDVNAWAEDVHKDWWVIHAALLDAIAAGDVGLGCDEVTMDDAVSFGPAGSTGGWSVVVRATLERDEAGS